MSDYEWVRELARWQSTVGVYGQDGAEAAADAVAALPVWERARLAILIDYREVRECRWCGRSFRKEHSRGANWRYCSDRCRAEANSYRDRGHYRRKL